MRSIILCEGVFDAILISCYLERVYGWESLNHKKYREKKKKLKKKLATFGASDNQKSFWYFNKNDELLCIFAVGSYSMFEAGIKEVLQTTLDFPDLRFDKFVVFSDRDDDDSQDKIIDDVQNGFNESGIIFVKVEHRSWNKSIPREIDGEFYEVNLLPIIVPFEENGTLETVLMNARKEKDTVEKKLVENCIDFVDEQLKDDEIKGRYLKSRGIRPKAKFGTYLSIYSPDRSFDEVSDLLLSFEWENSDELKKIFEPMEELLSNQEKMPIDQL